ISCPLSPPTNEKAISTKWRSPLLHLRKHPRCPLRHDTFLHECARIPDLHPTLELATGFDPAQFKTSTTTHQHTWPVTFIHNGTFRHRRNGVSINHNARLNVHACPERYRGTVDMAMNAESTLLRIALGTHQQDGALVRYIRTDRADLHVMPFNDPGDILLEYIQLDMQVVRIHYLENYFRRLHKCPLSIVRLSDVPTDRRPNAYGRLNGAAFKNTNVNADHLQTRPQSGQPPL